MASGRDAANPVRTGCQYWGQCTGLNEYKSVCLAFPHPESVLALCAEMPQMPPTSLSLYSNLKLCQLPLAKLNQTYGTVKPIADGLKKLMTNVDLCQKLCVNEESEDAYDMVFDRLLQATTNHHTLLQIYFSRSPYWEHYDRNMSEIIALLERTVNERHQSQQPVKFQRRFLPLSSCIGLQGGVHRIR